MMKNFIFEINNNKIRLNNNNAKMEQFTLEITQQISTKSRKNYIKKVFLILFSVGTEAKLQMRNCCQRLFKEKKAVAHKMRKINVSLWPKTQKRCKSKHTQMENYYDYFFLFHFIAECFFLYSFYFQLQMLFDSCGFYVNVIPCDI